MGGPLGAGDPAELGGYRILRRLGQGGMGTVYLGEDAAGHRVAVKVINPQAAGNEMFQRRFRAEVAAARRVRPFCTAPVLDARLDGEPLFVVTEFVEGPDLGRAVAEKGPLRGSNTEALAVGVATALSAIHAAGIVHRDLKPSNVLLSPLGPRVIDFGIARAFDAVDGLTATGQLIGTPLYMAPELFHGQPVTSAYDVFAWGGVVAFAAGGRAPFEGRSVPEILYRIAHDPPRLDGLEPQLRELVVAALAKDPSDRPTAQQLLDRLVGHRADPARTAAAARVELATPPPRPSPSAPPTPPPPSPQPTAQPRTPSASHRLRNRLLVVGAVLAAVVPLSVAGIAAVEKMRSSEGERNRSGPSQVTDTSKPVTKNGPEDVTAAPARRELFSDAFEDPSSGWPPDGTLTPKGYEDGAYHLASNSTVRGLAIAPYKAALPDSMVLGVTGRFSEGDDSAELGVWCWGTGTAAEDDVRYEFLVRRDGHTWIRKFDEHASPQTTSIASGQVPAADDYELEAACTSDEEALEFTLWVNGSKALQGRVEDSRPSYEGIGLVVTQARDASEDTRAVFDDFSLSEGP